MTDGNEYETKKIVLLLELTFLLSSFGDHHLVSTQIFPKNEHFSSFSDTHLRVGIMGFEMLVFRKILCTYMDDALRIYVGFTFPTLKAAKERMFTCPVLIAI